MRGRGGILFAYQGSGQTSHVKQSLSHSIQRSHPVFSKSDGNDLSRGIHGAWVAGIYINRLYFVWLGNHINRKRVFQANLAHIGMALRSNLPS